MTDSDLVFPRTDQRNSEFITLTEIVIARSYFFLVLKRCESHGSFRNYPQHERAFIGSDDFDFDFFVWLRLRGIFFLNDRFASFRLGWFIICNDDISSLLTQSGQAAVGAGEQDD